MEKELTDRSDQIKERLEEAKESLLIAVISACKDSSFTEKEVSLLAKTYKSVQALEMELGYL